MDIFERDSGTTTALRATSPNARPLAGSTAAELPDRWLDLAMFDQQPLAPALSGLKLEYRIIQLYARDAGQREAKISFNVGQGTQDLGFRGEVRYYRTGTNNNVNGTLSDQGIQTLLSGIDYWRGNVGFAFQW